MALYSNTLPFWALWSLSLGLGVCVGRKEDMTSCHGSVPLAELMGHISVAANTTPIPHHDTQ